ncbi:DUF1684 domain-containing protein, partial [Leucobacter sp. M11]|uniref:DUF1684 domain-containing protein n=1 Tax=Leucobacter sp. M11 TaxID=2993565 RepID=UPI002D7F46B6
WQAWHEGVEAKRREPHGFLSPVGFAQLAEQPQRLDALPGEWSTGPDGPVVRLGPGERLDDPSAPGRAITGEHRFGPIPAGDLWQPHGELMIEILRRGSADLVRLRDPNAPLRTGYAGTPAYAPRAEWAIPGRFEPFSEPREAVVGAFLEGLEHVFEAPGTVVFERDGAEHRLTVFNGAAPGALQALFRDDTSGVTTYGLMRSLAIAAPDEQGRVLLDFTRAVNMPCAYTDHAACPMPPRENRLALAVEAGEQIPTHRSTAAGVVPQSPALG